MKKELSESCQKEESEYMSPSDCVFAQKKKSVSLSMTETQITQLDERANQTGLNRSTQIQRDLNAYWFMLQDGLRRLQNELTVDDARYIAQIFRGRRLASCEDALWADEFLCAFVRRSGLYCEAERATKIANILEKAGTLARFALMDWVRRVVFNSSEKELFEHWKV